MVDLFVSPSGSAKAAVDIVVGTGAGSKSASKGYIGTASGNKIFFTSAPALTAANISPDPVSGSGFDTDASISTDTATCAATGGSANLSYLWEYVSGDTEVLIASSGAQSTSFYVNPTGPATYSTVFRCTITDNDTSTTVSDTVTANITVMLDLGGGGQ